MKLARLFKNFIDSLIYELGFQQVSFLPPCGEGLRKGGMTYARRGYVRPPHPDPSASSGQALPPQGGKEATPLRLGRGKYFRPIVLIGFLFLACAQIARAQLIPL